MACEAKRIYFYIIRNQKKRHWEEFLNDIKNIWQAAKYLSGDDKVSFSLMSVIIENTGELVHKDNNIAKALFTSFFPSLPPYPFLSHTVLSNQLSMESLINKEIQKVIISASSYKAPGRDKLLMIVWQHIWPIIGQQMLNLFREYIKAERIPREWKTARIISLRKPDKLDYTVANTYRLISLLYTISKVFKAVLIIRIVYLTETHSLLPSNHFGALKERFMINTLQILQEKIY